MGLLIPIKGDIDNYPVINPVFTKELHKKYPQLKGYSILQIMEQFDDFLIKKITSYRDGISLPSFIGNMFMGAFPNKGNDYTVIPGKKKRIYVYNNKHIDGFDSRCYYSTATVGAKFEAGKYWGFMPSGPMKKAINWSFKHNWKYYIVVPNVRYMEEIFRRRKGVEQAKAIQQDKLKDYDEFKFD